MGIVYLAPQSFANFLVILFENLFFHKVKLTLHACNDVMLYGRFKTNTRNDITTLFIIGVIKLIS